MARSRITRRRRTTVPAVLRARRAILTRAEEIAEAPFATFDEWDSPADRVAYSDL